ncbi:MAG: hypothetical protein NTU95_06980 [Methanothrix sp.]|nr:hypothetical protein [Methanothrix sp.]
MPVPIQKLSLFLLIVALLLQSSHADEENDLWLLISSYEDIGISLNDLATFLAAHGYNAKPAGSYVTVTFSGGNEVYLTPNGAAPRLADLWMTAPEKPVGPIRVNYDESIKKNATYAMSSNPEFVKSISRSVLFPLMPLGMCYEGSKQLGIIYTGMGSNVTYMFHPDDPGHEWILVEDGSTNTWLAVDSYYGVMTSSDYYAASYSFPRFDLLDLVNPQWRIG